MKSRLRHQNWCYRLLHASVWLLLLIKMSVLNHPIAWQCQTTLVGLFIKYIREVNCIMIYDLANKSFYNQNLLSFSGVNGSLHLSGYLISPNRSSSWSKYFCWEHKYINLSTENIKVKVIRITTSPNNYTLGFGNLQMMAGFSRKRVAMCQLFCLFSGCIGNAWQSALSPGGLNWQCFSLSQQH